MPDGDTMSGAPTFPVVGLPKRQADLEFSRKKPRSLLLSASYRIYRAGRKVLGDNRVLPFLLDASWVAWRLAYELSYEVIGPEFPNQTYGVTKDLLREWLPENGSVIDVGCGMGRLCALAAPRAKRVLGVDYDAGRIETARQRVSSVYPHVEFKVGDVFSAIGDETFDLALLVGVLEHIEDGDGLLSGLSKVARRIIVEVPDFLADPLNLVRRDRGTNWYSDADHVREYSTEILQEQLRRCGWKTELMRSRGLQLLAVATPANANPG